MNDCECNYWARTDGLLAEHHPNCKHYDPVGDAQKIIVALLLGIEAWAADEDGVHPDCLEAYENARLRVVYQTRAQEKAEGVDAR